MKHRLILITLIATSSVVPTIAAAQGCISASSRSSGQVRGSTSISSHDDDDEQRLQIRWRSGTCELRVSARGKFSVRADLSAITSITDGGYVEIEEIEGRRDRMVRITSDRSGALQYRWTVGGDNGFDVNREQWLADILLAIERRTAMFAKSRVPELIRQGGPRAVLDETDRMDGDYARRTYFTILLANARLDEGMLERMLRQAGDMSSDYERSEVVRAVAKNGPMTDRVTRAAIAVATRMSSDYEKRRALSAGLESVNTLEARNALFTAASTMSSNYELAELLIAAQQRSMVDSLTRLSYFRAVDRLQSDYEHRRTLSALLKSRPTSLAVLSDVLRSSEFIDSDYELASLLVEFSKLVPVRGELRTLYLKAARSLSSDHEYRRALQALLEQDKAT
jgi:hypothetical protein